MENEEKVKRSFVALLNIFPNSVDKIEESLKDGKIDGAKFHLKTTDAPGCGCFIANVAFCNEMNNVNEISNVNDYLIYIKIQRDIRSVVNETTDLDGDEEYYNKGSFLFFESALHKITAGQNIHNNPVLKQFYDWIQEWKQERVGLIKSDMEQIFEKENNNILV